MSDITATIAEKNGLNKDNIDWVIPHQANLRIIDAVASRLEVPLEKVMINIQRYGNTSACYTSVVSLGLRKAAEERR